MSNDHALPVSIGAEITPPRVSPIAQLAAIPEKEIRAMGLGPASAFTQAVAGERRRMVTAPKKPTQDHDRWIAVSGRLRNAIATVVLALAGVSTAQGQSRPSSMPPVCDRLVPQSGVLGYAARGDYCEGLYVQPVGSILRLVALQSRGAGPAEAGQLTATIPAAAAGISYHLRLTAADPGVPYQLDASVREGRFAWPTKAVVDPVLGTKPALDAIAWAGEDLPLFVPVSLAGTGVTVGTSIAGSRAVILSTVPVEDYTAHLLGPSGQMAFSRDVRLRPAATRIELDLPPRLAVGTYQLWLRVRLLGIPAPEQQSWRMRLP